MAAYRRAELKERFRALPEIPRIFTGKCPLYLTGSAMKLFMQLVEQR